MDRYPSTDKSGKNKICIVADKVSDFQSIEGVDVITPDKVQGSEYDFVIIESGLGKRGNGGAYSAVKDLYTLSQRATRGVIVASEAKAFARSIEDPSSAIDIRLSDEQIKKFIEWKKKLYSKISDEVVDGRVVNVDRTPTPSPTPNPNPPTPKEKDIQYKEFGEKKSIEIGTKRCASKYFYEWWENPEKNTNKIPFNEFWRDSDFLKDSGLSEKDLKKVHHILRSYYLYGHYKEDKFETLKDLLGF